MSTEQTEAIMDHHPQAPGKADGVPSGTDTFVRRDGRVAVQTVALHFG